MRTLELGNYGVLEIGHREMIETEGGLIPFVLLGVALLLHNSTFSLWRC
jgi:hypothetical protein